MSDRNPYWYIKPFVKLSILKDSNIDEESVPQPFDMQECILQQMETINKKSRDTTEYESDSTTIVDKY